MKHLQVTESNQICEVTLNRPDKHNAFNAEMIHELTTTFRDLEKRTDLIAVYLRGAGKSFSAGGDLEWMRSMVSYSYEENLQDARLLFDMFDAIAGCSLPILGLVHGNVMGGGLGLVAVCDVVAAEARTKFCFSEARIGIAPAVISPFVLRKANHGGVREFMLSARTFSADEARRIGLVHFCGDRDGIEQFARDTLKSFAECSSPAVREAKRLMNFIATQPWSMMRDRCSQVIAERRVSVDGQEGLKAFLEKREPAWRAKSR